MRAVFPYILIILYLLTGAIPALGAIDILAPQWIFLGSINLMSCAYLFFNSSSFSHLLYKLLNNYFFWSYFILIVWATTSYFYAINQVETIINLPRYFNVFVACIFCLLLISKIKNPIQYVVYVFAGFLLIEISAYYKDFLEVY